MITTCVMGVTVGVVVKVMPSVALAAVVLLRLLATAALDDACALSSGALIVTTMFTLPPLSEMVIDVMLTFAAAASCARMLSRVALS